jgi:hypothetical protein
MPEIPVLKGFFKRAAKVSFSPKVKKQALRRYLLTIHEILAIIWQNEKNSPKNKIKFPQTNVTFVALVHQLDARQLGHNYTLCMKGRTN